MKVGYVHSIESLGALDGPGLRTVVFMQGCNLRCRYCHNPDTWQRSCGTVYTPQELLEKVIKFKPYFKRNGGITVSGGEPLLQAEFLYEFFMLLKQENIHTALDTAGFLNEKVKKLLTLTDLVILDIKHTDQAEYKKLTGAELNKTLEFYNYLLENKIDFWIRQVIVPGINDEPDQVKELAKYCVSAKKYELIPYHTLGIKKWQELGLKYTLSDVAPPSRELMKELRKTLDNEVKKLKSA
ncbi:MAG TPA: pyruvate formate-lyase-activating protein [Clostridia bacterium]|jgi:pyruvate formate lyase activating enzyme